MTTAIRSTVVLPKNGQYSLTTKKNSYYVQVFGGVIKDCAPVLRENYMDVHIKYLVSFLTKTQGEVEIKPIK